MRRLQVRRNVVSNSVTEGFCADPNVNHTCLVGKLEHNCTTQLKKDPV